MSCDVLIVGLPPAASCPPGKTWRAAAGLVGSRLAGRFGSAVHFEYVDLFSAEMASHPEIEPIVAAGAMPPIVLIQGELHASGSKLYVSAIERAVAERLAALQAVPPTEEPVS